MKQSGICPKCKSTTVVADARVSNRQNLGNLDQAFMVSTDLRTDARKFKETRTSVVTAWVCGACGYTEFYTFLPESLLA